MKKIFIVLATLLLALLSVNSIVAEDDVENIKVSIDYDSDNNTYKVKISDTPIISSQKPTMQVNTDFKKAKVYYDNEGTLELIDSTISNSIVSFSVEKGGVYIVEKANVSTSKSKYIAPKTGIQ